MNRKLLLSAMAVTAACVCFTSCEKTKNIGSTTITWDGVDVTITVPPVADTAIHTDMGTGTFSFDLDSFVKSKTNNLMSASDIDDMEVESCDLKLQNPDAGNNYQNFKMAEVRIYSDAKSTSTLIANIDNNPDVYSDTMKCPKMPKSVLKDYFRTSGPSVIHYVLGGQLRTPTTNSTVHIVRVRVRVTKD